MEARIASFESHTGHLNTNVVEVRSGVARLETKIDDLGMRLDRKIDDCFDRLGSKIDRHCVILGGMIVSLGIGLAGLMAKGFHWL